MKPTALLTVLLSLCAVPVGAQNPDPDAAIVAGKAPLPGLQLTLVAPKTQYEQGEPIEVTMRYTYTGPRPLAVEVVTYNRSGRIMEFGFTAADASGQAVIDPTPFQGGMGGGLRGETTLTPTKPYEQKATVNEWLRFDKPGAYSVTAHSSIVSLNDNREEFSTGPHIPLDSPPLLLTIAPPDEAHRQAQLARDRAALNSKTEATRIQALRSLRLLVDPRAVPLLVQGLNDPSPNAQHEAWFGLRAFPDMAPVKAALLKEINTPSNHIAMENQYFYVNLLTEADMKAQGKTPGMFDAATNQASAKWNALFAAKEKADLKTLPPAKAAEETVVGLAVGPLSHTDLKNWKRAIDNAALMSQPSQSYLGTLLGSEGDLRETFPDVRILKPLIPDLKRLAANPHLDGDLRSGAFVTLHALGNDSLRDLVASDLLLPQPKFRTAAHATLGKYRAKDIGSALVRLMASQDGDVQQSAAVRLRDFGVAVPAATLIKLLRSDVSGNYAVHDALLEALALKSPNDALPFIARDIRNPTRPYSGVSDTAVRLLCRMNTPEARMLVEGLFSSPNYHDRQTAAQAMQESWDESSRPNSGMFDHSERHMPPNAALTASFFPNLLMMYQHDPNGDVHAAARLALATITNIPKNGFGQVTRAQEAAWEQQWKAWWSVTAHGIGYQRRSTP